MSNPIKTYSIEAPTHPAMETLARRKELKELTGCTHAYVIDGHCSEPGCANSLISPGAEIQWEEIPQPVIDTHPRKWCVL